MKVMMIQLGCDKNLVDSEMMLGVLADNGFELTDDEETAEVIVVNTCSFILDSKQESIDTIIEMGRLKQNGQLKCLVCAGCLAQRYADEIKNELPEVDVLVGTTAFDKIAEAINAYFDKKNENTDEIVKFIEDKDRLVSGLRRVVSTGGHYAYLKISEGCDKKCTYCAIPSMRGKYRSVPMETLIDEARSLAERGVVELILVAQETTVYGEDIYGEKSLHKLLKELCKIEDLKWIRLLYCYPEEIYDELIYTIKTEEKICKYLDIPIQHADDYILQRMGRRTDRRYIENLVEKLRTEIPEICLRTTLIVGFPGEEDEHFENLKDFIKKMRFDRLGVFAYSPEDGTVAEKMPKQVDDAVKEKRRDECMIIQQQIAFEKAKEHIGRVLPVMVEGRIPEGALVARTYMDAPDVDGYVFIDTDAELPCGTFVNVEIFESNEYDLIGGMAE